MAAILYDHREQRSMIPGLLALRGLDLEVRQLPVGDYILSDELVVERKTGTDLVASIKDRRLWEQIERLKEAYPKVVLLVEGEPDHFPREGWLGALASVLTDPRVSVLQTVDNEASADWIARLARRETRGPSEARGSQRKPKDADQLAESILSAFPGISAKGAGALLDHFGSLHAVAGAEPTELRQVPGIGPKRAQTLAAVFRHAYKARPF